MTRTSKAPTALLVAATLSGMAALQFETLWDRSLGIILGSTVQAHAVVFAAFMLGLAAGASLCGRFADAFRDPAKTYAWVEFGIGASGAGVGLLLHRYGNALAGSTASSTSLSGTLGALVLTIAMVAIPTSLMGATFPLLLATARRARDDVGDLYTVYALNTFGAAIGALSTALIAIPTFGVTGSLVFAATCNVLAAASALEIPRRRRDRHPAPSSEEPAVSTDRIIPPRWMLLVTASLSGAVVLSLEVIWSRLASYFLGNRTFAFTVLLAWVLLSLSVGAWLAGRIAKRFGRDGYLLFGWLHLIGGGVSVLALLFASWWIGVQRTFESSLPFADSLIIVYRVLETGLLLGPFMIVLGCVFPASLLYDAGRADSTGRLAGRFYFANTAGAVTGSLLTGFVGLKLLGSFACAGVLALSCVGVGTLFLLRSSDSRWRRLGAALAGTVALSTLPLFSLELGLRFPDDEAIYRIEDDYGVFQVFRQPDGLLRVVNNRTELVYLLGRPETDYVQQMQGHLGMFFNPKARTAVVLGSGYGITAGALGLYAQLERIDAVEILPGMVEAAPLFSPYHFDYQENPRIHVTVDDARHFLARTDTRYDIVSVNVSDPHLPGGSALFHREFYSMAKERLAPHGVFVQHAFGVDVDIILATLDDAFPYLVKTRAYGNGFNVVASLEPLDMSAAEIERLTSATPVRNALRGLGFIPPFVPAFVFGQRDLPSVDTPEAPIATDDRPRLEFSWSGETKAWLFSNE